MTPYQYNETKQHLLQAATLLAPTRLSQSAIVSMLHDAEAEADLTHRQILRRLTAVIYDGLANDIWPAHNLFPTET